MEDLNSVIGTKYLWIDGLQMSGKAGGYIEPSLKEATDLAKKYKITVKLKFNDEYWTIKCSKYSWT